MLCVGAGPAGLSLAAALTEAGARQAPAPSVALITPQWPAPWPNTYGFWLDDLHEDSALQACHTHRFERPEVYLKGDAPRALNRDYIRFDNEAARALLMRRFEKHGGRVIPGFVSRLRHEESESVATFCASAGGADREVRAQLIVLATGSLPGLIARQRPDEPGFQTAYGVRARVRAAPPGWLKGMRLMDFRSAGQDALDERRRPSFLYAMRLSEREVFLEETSMVARPGVAIDVLERRLNARLKREGVKLEAPLEEELCRIPMGEALPDLTQRTLAWGAAAGAVNPASGYQVAKAMRRAGEVASGLLGALDEPDGQARSRRAWEVIWPRADRARRALYRYGMEALLPMDREGLCAFFESFFDQPEALWRAYHSDRIAHGALLASMAHVFARCGAKNRGALLAPAWRSSQMRSALARGVLGGAAQRRGTMSDQQGAEIDLARGRVRLALRPGDAWRGVAIAAGIYAFWLGMLALNLIVIEWSGWQLALAPLAILAQTFAYTGLFITAHDAMHGTACWRSKRVNDAIGVVALGSYALFSFKRLVAAHRLHHDHPARVEQDPDFHDGARRTLLGWYATFLWRYITWVQVLGMAAVFNVLAHGVGIDQIKLLAFWVAPSLLSTFQLFYFGTYLTHRERPDAPYEDGHRARSDELGLTLSLLSCYHFGGFHWEHHAAPQAPWWRLPQVRRAAEGGRREAQQMDLALARWLLQGATASSSRAFWFHSIRRAAGMIALFERVS